MDTITIKLLNKKIIVLFLFAFLFAFLSCSSQKGKVSIVVTKCKLFEDNFNRVSFSENQKDLSNVELNHFYEDENGFDIILYNHLEGSNDFSLKRFYKNKLNIWISVTIENGKRNETNAIFDELEVINYLNKVEQKSFYQYCGTCFDCVYYTFLIKKNETIFKYYSNGEVFSGIDIIEREKLFNYINIYDFFIKK